MLDRPIEDLTLPELVRLPRGEAGPHWIAGYHARNHVTLDDRDLDEHLLDVVIGVPKESGEKEQLTSGQASLVPGFRVRVGLKCVVDVRLHQFLETRSLGRATRERLILRKPRCDCVGRFGSAAEGSAEDDPSQLRTSYLSKPPHHAA